MKRIGKGAAGATAVLVVLFGPVGAAPAHGDDHRFGITPPSILVDPPFIDSGRFSPGTRQRLGIAAAAIEPTGSYSGTLSSTPASPLEAIVTSAGLILWADVLIPADFELGGDHRITVVDNRSGAVVAVSDFYVGVDGTVRAFAPASVRSGTTSRSESVAERRSGTSGERAAGDGRLDRIASDPDAPAKLAVGLVALAALTVLSAHKRHDEMAPSS